MFGGGCCSISPFLVVNNGNEHASAPLLVMVLGLLACLSLWGFLLCAHVTKRRSSWACTGNPNPEQETIKGTHTQETPVCAFDGFLPWFSSYKETQRDCSGFGLPMHARLLRLFLTVTTQEQHTNKAPRHVYP